MSKRRVVITGLGIVSPVGSTVDVAWKNVLDGKSGIGPITRFDVSAWPVRFHGAVVGFEDAPVALSAHPPLTTVHQSPEQMGREMVALLLATMADPDLGQEGRMLPTYLVVRDSS